jgi:hypothetical protein
VKIKRRRFADARAARLARNGRALLVVSGVAATFTGAAYGGGGVTWLTGQGLTVVVVTAALAVACYVLAYAAERAAETAWRVAELRRLGAVVVEVRRPRQAAPTVGQSAADLVRAAMARKAEADAARRLDAFERQEAEADRLAAFERAEWLASLSEKRDASVVRDGA